MLLSPAVNVNVSLASDTVQYHVQRSTNRPVRWLAAPNLLAIQVAVSGWSGTDVWWQQVWSSDRCIC